MDSMAVARMPRELSGINFWEIYRVLLYLGSRNRMTLVHHDEVR